MSVNLVKTDSLNRFQEGPSDDSAPVAVATAATAPVINNPAFQLNNAVFSAPVVGQLPFAGTCYNWKGEGVPCRTVF
jgi:hypothetical protein